MVKITGNFGKVKSWINRLIRTKATGNLFVGTSVGLATTGNFNDFVGYQAGYSNSSGIGNSFMGYQAGYGNISGNYNNFVGGRAGYVNNSGYSNDFMGYQAGYYNNTGHSNGFMGFRAGYTNSTGNSNNFVGYQAGYSNSDGNNNTCIGSLAGYTNIHGHGNCCIGYKAGYFETGNYKLFIDDAARTDEADGRIKALIYGIFDTLTANQLFRINGILQLTEIKSGTDQANAGAAANEVWKTASHASLPDNVLMIGV